MDSDSRPRMRRRFTYLGVLIGVVLVLALSSGFQASSIDATGHDGNGQSASSLTLSVLMGAIVLIMGSAFFSGSETAFLSIHRIRLRVMAEDGTLTGSLVAHLMDTPGRLLTTILVGNMLVNVMIGVVFGARVEMAMANSNLITSEMGAYAAAVGITTGIVFVFGEITPKVFAVTMGERFARVVVLPLLAVDRVLAPIRNALLRVTETLFQVSHFHDLHAAPFITDDEIKSVLTNGDAAAVIEEDDRQMIQGILEVRDARLREIRVPRPDVVALSEDATVRDALAAMREHEFSRMPVYRDNLDTILGILVAKDMIPCIAKGDLDRPVTSLVRDVHYVPETMTVAQFVNDAQRRRSHMAIVVDEYGGTDGIVTLEDALEEVVGDILDEDEQIPLPLVQLEPGVYRVEGSCYIEDLSKALGISLEDEEHETVAGFLMAKLDKVPETGDMVQVGNLQFTIEKCEGKRAQTVLVHIYTPASSEEAPS